MMSREEGLEIGRVEDMLLHCVGSSRWVDDDDCT